MTVKPLLDMVDDWEEFLSVPPSDEERNAIRRHERTGRPLGGEAFLTKIERTLRRTLRPAKRGRKPKRHAGEKASK